MLFEITFLGQNVQENMHHLKYLNSILYHLCNLE